MNANIRPAAARAFVRSLNILLKFARMYDFGHPRTKKQYETAWAELRTALGVGTGNESGVLLAVSGENLLLDGTPLESAAAEKNFARMLSAAGIASIHFSPKVTQASLARFVRGFPTGTGAKPIQLAEQLKSALQGDPHIHVNEVCFVPADSAVARSTVAQQLAAHTLGLNSEASDELFKDPERLLQLIVAAEGTKGKGKGNGSGDGDGNGNGNGDGNGGGYGGTGNGPGNGGSGYGYQTGGSGGGSGEGQGAGYGSGPGGFGNGSGESGPGGGGPGGNGSGSESSGGGHGHYAADSAEIVRDFPSWKELSGGASPVYVEGSADSGENSGPGNGGGNAGGGDSSGGDSGASTWNIVGGSGGGTQLAPDAAGFWFNKGGGNEAGPGGSGSGSGSRRVSGGASNDISVQGSSSGTDFGAGPGTSGGSHGPGRGGSGRAGSGQPGSGKGGSGSGGGTGTGGSGTGRKPGGSSARVWDVTADQGGEPGAPTRWGSATAGIRGSRSARTGGGSMAVETGLMTLHEDELKGILQMLSQIARTSESSGGKIDAEPFQSRLSTLPRRARFTVSQALSALAAQAPSDSADKPTLLKLAEHIAIRFAMESYERGDIEVNAVRQVLDEMSQELDTLRKITGVYEEKLARHGIHVESHLDMLAQQFWAQVPDEKRKAVLESAEAWCVPPVQVREYIDRLLAAGEKETAEKILANYANCITHKSSETRRQAATGIAELAGLYANQDEQLLMNTIRQVGIQLAEEGDSELQSVVGAAFVRLSQEAANKRSFPAIQRAVELVEYVETERPGVGANLRPRINVENRLPEFIEEALKKGEVPSGLKDLMRRMPAAASGHLAGRFSRAGFREDCDMLVSMMQVLDTEGLENLRVHLRKGTPAEAIEALGLLARMDPDLVELVLPDRILEWKRTVHDRVVRQISSSGSPDRGRLLLKLFDFLDPLIRPLAVDEIGMSGDQSADMRLLRMAEGDLPKGGTDYLRLKAIEALGRLRTQGAESVLRKIAETRRAFRWASHSELRLVASQAMEKIDPEWVRSFVPRSGLSIAEFSIVPLDRDPESSAIRQRRYPRLRLEHSVAAATTNLKENCRLDIPELTLGGGVAVCEQSLHPGSVVDLKLSTSQKSVKMETIVRDANTQARAFEVVDMDLEERAKLRRLLVQLGNALKASSSKERVRRGTRTIFAPPA